MKKKSKRGARRLKNLRVKRVRVIPDHPTTAYAKAVLAGEITTGRAIRLACQRHLKDLERTDLRFDEKAAIHAIDFFPFLRLNGKRDAPFYLEPWEKFVVGSLFGWKNAAKLRRFTTAYIEVGKGAGKTSLAAGVGHYGLIADGEQAAEIYAAAVTREQAHLLFDDAKNMIENNPDLANKLDIGMHNIAYKPTLSFFRPVSSEGKSLDAKRVHMALIDELHEHRTDIVVNKMDLGKKGRRQPLTFEITNAGHDQTTVCYQHHAYCIAILEGRIQNDSWFAYICQLDPCADCQKEGKLSPSDNCKKCDDWRDEKVWTKTNPSLHINQPRIEYLRDKVLEAIGMPAKQNIVKRMNFCMWTQQETRWLDLDLWDAGKDPIEQEALRGRVCFAGLDLSSNRDLTALALVFPPADLSRRWIVRLRFWIPAENVDARIKKDAISYDVWIREGWIETTPGNVIDKDFIEAAILEDAEIYRIQEVAYDRFFADQLVQHLEAQKPGWKEDNQWCVPIGMGFYSMAAPCKEFERLVQGKLIQQGNNPVLRWNAGNVTVKLDPAGNMKPTKEDDKKRIDGIVAILMALARAIVVPKEIKGESVYDKREPLTL